MDHLFPPSFAVKPEVTAAHVKTVDMDFALGVDDSQSTSVQLRNVLPSI